MEKTKLTKMNRKTVLFLLLAVALTCLVAFNQYIFGNKLMAFDDIGSDTIQQYLTQYNTIITKIQNGDWSIWNEYYGFGANMYMLNPFNPMLIILYIIGIFSGIKTVAYVLIWWYMAEILLSAFCAYTYLSVFNLGERAKGVASYMFAFNGFLIVWGQHYQFGVVCILFPLLLWAVERMLRNKRCWPALVIVSAFITLNSMYLAYMMFLCVAFYVMFRVFMREKNNFIGWFKKVFSLAMPMVLGLAIGAISLLPSYMAISSVSSRLNSDLTILGRLSGSFTPYISTYYRTLLDRIFTSTGEGINAFDGYLNYYEAPCMFFTTLFVILFFQYIFTLPSQKSNRKQKILQIIFLILAAAGLYFPAAGVILNGFTAPFSRYTFLYMPYFLLISAFTLERMIKEKKLSLIALILSGALIIWRYVYILKMPWIHSRRMLLLLLASGFCMVCGILILHFAKNKTIRKLMIAGLIFVLGINACAETYSNFGNREVLEKDDDYFNYLTDEDTLEALRMIREADDGSYRIEKLYGATTSMDSLLLGYQSDSTYNSTQNRYIIDYVNDFWPTLVYLDQNHYDFEEGTDNADQAALTGVKYILYDSEDDDGDTIPEGYSLWNTVGSVEIYKSDTVESIYTFYDEGSYTQQDNEVTVNYEDRDENADIGLEESISTDESAGTVTVSESGVLFTGIPYEEGWSITVDGEEQTTLLADEGFQAVYLPSGTHTISIKYVCPLFKEGVMVSAAGIIVFILLLIIRRRRAVAK